MNLLLEPMPVMIWLAVIIEAVLLKWTDMTILLGIQLANASISFYEISKAGNAVAALKVQQMFMFLLLVYCCYLNYDCDNNYYYHFHYDVGHNFHNNSLM